MADLDAGADPSDHECTEPDPWGLRGDVAVGVDPAAGEDETVLVRARRRPDGRLELLDTAPAPPRPFPLAEAVGNLAMLRLAAMGGAR
ncbi:MAG TPA: hypothetical protein VF765_31275 [Polyangiaceae bacterium]